MKKVLLSFSVLFICLILSGCTQEKFYLEDKYYNNKEFVELDEKSLNELIENKESFAIFIYQPLCVASNNFNQVLTEFSEKNNVSFYKMAYSNMKKTVLGKKIKYYPSLVIYKDGKLVDYLDANSKKDVSYYKNVDGFNSWFSKYVLIK